ncbi:MAG: hypothetical protein JRI65_13780 [Deltaproteobacteria bacterium]|nr:hypothetical protein [Deltaproteobacteria bacterium]
MKRFVMVVLAMALTGCAGFGQIERVESLSSEQLRRLNSIKIYESAEGLNYTEVGEVKGLSCKGSPFSGDTRKDAAMTQLKIKAVKANANAILYPVCSHDASVDWGNNCWESWVCIGIAARVE